MSTEHRPDWPQVEWDRPKLERFKVAFAAADKGGKEEFVFDSYPYLTDYAKYLIEYLEGQLQ